MLDVTRLRVLEAVARTGSVTKAAADLHYAQPTVSHHLKVLRDAGLVTSEKRGVNMWYAVVPATLELLRDALGR